jgi:hypothetical protein
MAQIELADEGVNRGHSNRGLCVMEKRCPHCDIEMEHESDDPSVGIVGGWFCHHCEIAYPDDDWSEEDYVGL